MQHIMEQHNAEMCKTPPMTLVRQKLKNKVQRDLNLKMRRLKNKSLLLNMCIHVKCACQKARPIAAKKTKCATIWPSGRG